MPRPKESDQIRVKSRKGETPISSREMQRLVLEILTIFDHPIPTERQKQIYEEEINSGKLTYIQVLIARQALHHIGRDCDDPRTAYTWLYE